jgi:hypothetical protein
MALQDGITQSNRTTLIEAMTETVMGSSLAVATQFVVFPASGLHVSVVENFGLGLVFTGVSIVRWYALRRQFDRFSL